MDIIPAIDVINGACVRLTQGNYNKVSVYNNNPLEVAKAYEAAGITRLHLVDLDGAKKGEVVNWKVLEQIANSTNLQIDFSGGLSNEMQIATSFNSGAAYVAIGSMAVNNQTLFAKILQLHNPSKFILAADVKGEYIVTKGWTETSNLTITEFINAYSKLAITQYFCTDVDKDGMLQGTATALYSKLLIQQSNLQLIASGGVSNLQDVENLKQIGCSGVIIGKAIYEGKITIAQLSNYINNN